MEDTSKIETSKYPGAQSTFINGEHRFAIFNEDRSHRYVLGRQWNTTRSVVAFIGLNPSTADEHQDDPTIRRVTAFARSWGFGGVLMLNLFSIVSSDPKILLTSADPIGENDRYLTDFLPIAQQVIFSWGNFDVGTRANDFIKLFSKIYPWKGHPVVQKLWYCLGQNKNGSPKHPLYLKADTEPTLYARKPNSPKAKVRNFKKLAS